MFFFLFLYLLVELFFECVVGKIRGHKKTDKCLYDTTIGGSPPIRIDATIGVAYYPFMASMPQWELPYTKVELIGQ